MSILKCVLHFGDFEGDFWYFDHFSSHLLAVALFVTEVHITLVADRTDSFSLSFNVAVSRYDNQNDNDWNNGGEYNDQDKSVVIAGVSLGRRNIYRAVSTNYTNLSTHSQNRSAYVHNSWTQSTWYVGSHLTQWSMNLCIVRTAILSWTVQRNCWACNESLNDDGTVSDTDNFESSGVDVQESADVGDEGSGAVVVVEVHDWDAESGWKFDEVRKSDSDLAVLLAIQHKFNGTVLVVEVVGATYVNVVPQISSNSVVNWERFDNNVCACCVLD